MGSNPAQSIQRSVQIPKSKGRDNRLTSKNVHLCDKVQIRNSEKDCLQIVDYKMRDLHNRAEKLAYWLKRIETDLQGSDKEDVLSLVRFMQDHERSSLWIIRCITILIQVRKQLQKPFREASLDDIRMLLRRLDNKDYKSSSIEKFRKVLKFFFKVVYGQNRYYPEQVQWIYTKVLEALAEADLNHYVPLIDFIIKRIINTMTILFSKTSLFRSITSDDDFRQFFTLYLGDDIHTKFIDQLIQCRRAKNLP